MKLVKIVSLGGSSNGTRIIDQGTGAEIMGVMSVSVRFAVDDVVKANIELYCAELDVVAQATFQIVHPLTSETIAISGFVLPDGSTISLAD